MSSNTKDLLPLKTTEFLSQKKTQFRLGSVPANKGSSYRPELMGKKYGWIEVISPIVFWVGDKLDKKGHKRRHKHVLAICSGCLDIKQIAYQNIVSGKTKGCQACSQPRRIPKWLDRRCTAMKSRCTVPNAKSYKNYGERGIKFNFNSVLEAGLWIQENLGLHRDLEIDRIDNNGHYEAGNLRYATRSQQCRNTRQSKTTVQQSTWALKQSPLSHFTTEKYFRNGKTIEEIILIAKLAVKQKRKNWRGIQKKLLSLGYMTS